MAENNTLAGKNFNEKHISASIGITNSIQVAVNKATNEIKALNGNIDSPAAQQKIGEAIGKQINKDMAGKLSVSEVTLISTIGPTYANYDSIKSTYSNQEITIKVTENIASIKEATKNISQLRAKFSQVENVVNLNHGGSTPRI